MKPRNKFLAALVAMAGISGPVFDSPPENEDTTLKPRTKPDKQMSRRIWRNSFTRPGEFKRRPVNSWRIFRGLPQRNPASLIDHPTTY